MKYVALLRGINVGGNNLIRMSELKKAFEDVGFAEVTTYINSGNVIFSTNASDVLALTQTLQTHLSKTFNYDARLVVISQKDFELIMSDVPKTWTTKHDLRCYIAFIRPPLSAHEIMQEIEVNNAVDFFQEGKGAVYLSTLLSGLTKSAYTKLVSKKIYKELTIRNYTTCQKLLALLK